MQISEIGDSDEQYLQRVAEDCEGILGPGIELDGLELGTNADVVLRLRYRLGDVDGMSEGRGKTIVAAHAELRQQLVLDRIRIGTSALYRRTR